MQSLSLSVSKIQGVSENGKNKALQLGFYILSIVGLEKVFPSLPISVVKNTMERSHGKPEFFTENGLNNVASISDSPKPSPKDFGENKYVFVHQEDVGQNGAGISSLHLRVSDLVYKAAQFMLEARHLSIHDIVSKLLYAFAENVKGAKLDQAEEKDVEKAIKAVIREVKNKFGSSSFKVDRVNFTEGSNFHMNVSQFVNENTPSEEHLKGKYLVPVTGFVIAYVEKDAESNDVLSHSTLYRINQKMHKEVSPKLFLATVKVQDPVYLKMRPGRVSSSPFAPKPYDKRSPFNLDQLTQRIGLDFLKSQLEYINQAILPNKFRYDKIKKSSEVIVPDSSAENEASTVYQYTGITTVYEKSDKRCRRRALYQDTENLSEENSPCSAMSFPASPGWQREILEEHTLHTKRRLNLVKEILKRQKQENENKRSVTTCKYILLSGHGRNIVLQDNIMQMKEAESCTDIHCVTTSIPLPSFCRMVCFQFLVSMVDVSCRSFNKVLRCGVSLRKRSAQQSCVENHISTDCVQSFSRTQKSCDVIDSKVSSLEELVISVLCAFEGGNVYLLFFHNNEFASATSLLKAENLGSEYCSPASNDTRLKPDEEETPSLSIESDSQLNTVSDGNCFSSSRYDTSCSSSSSDESANISAVYAGHERVLNDVFRTQACCIELPNDCSVYPSIWAMGVSCKVVGCFSKGSMRSTFTEELQSAISEIIGQQEVFGVDAEVLC